MSIIKLLTHTTRCDKDYRPVQTALFAIETAPAKARGARNF